MKILLLGGTGEIGKPLVEILRKNKPDFKLFITSRNKTESSNPVKYIHGNARNLNFLTNTLSEKFDVIVDFMNWNLDEYESALELLLSKCNQYIWMSSSRVYAESSDPITEQTPRLLDVSQDIDFLSTNRYALRKAREENLILSSGFNNFTIIRPYITYNYDRLQLGIYEKEQWLNRLIKGKPLVVGREFLDKRTTLTYGNDVALAISKLIGKKEAFSEVIQIASRETILWSQILQIYVKVLTEEGYKPVIYSSETISFIEELYEGGYNTIYDRNWNRCFNSEKLEKISNHRFDYRCTANGLTTCLKSFLQESRTFLYSDPEFEALQDIITNTASQPSDFDSIDNWNKYLEYREKHSSILYHNDFNLVRIV